MAQHWPERLPASWLRTLSQRYARPFETAERLHRGENDCWLLQGGGPPVILKLYRQLPQRRTALRQEIDLLARLEALGQPVAAYLADAAGERLQRLEDFPASLQPALAGWMWIDAPPAAYAALGRSLAELHALPLAPATLPLRQLDRTLLSDARWHALATADFLLPAERARFETHRQRVLAEFDFGPARLLHTDAHWGNVVLSADRLWLLDWEEAGWGNPLLDLATVEIHLLRHRAGEPCRAALYRGYGLTPDPPQLQRAMALRLLWLLSQIPSRLDIPELADPAEICAVYARRLDRLLGPA